MTLHKIKMYPDRDTFERLYPAHPARDTFNTARRDQSMVESGVTEGGKNTASFLFRE